MTVKNENRMKELVEEMMDIISGNGNKTNANKVKAKKKSDEIDDIIEECDGSFWDD